MPEIRPIEAVCYDTARDRDVSRWIAPPYDVIDQEGKDRLLAADPNNIVGVDLPHLPAKTVGPASVYEQAGERYRRWLREGVLVRRRCPAVFVYQQTYTVSPQAGTGGEGPKRYQRRGLIANLGLEPFGPHASADKPRGGIYAHEQTFAGPKQDRLMLMRATRAQTSAIFGMFSDAGSVVQGLFEQVVAAGSATMYGTTPHDGVFHEVWAVEDGGLISRFAGALSGADIIIADGHHRYTTALTYQQEQARAEAGDSGGGLQDPAHRANACLSVLVPMQDPGMIVRPTHRVLGGMRGFSMEAFAQASKGVLKITPFEGEGLAALEAALTGSGPHAIGLYCPEAGGGGRFGDSGDSGGSGGSGGASMAIVTTVEPDPLARTHPGYGEAWRQLDVAIVQHLIVERVCQRHFSPEGQAVAWRFPHSLEQLQADSEAEGFELGLLLQPLTLASIERVSIAGQTMPQKSTFFYPKLATGLVIQPLA